MTPKPSTVDDYIKDLPRPGSDRVTALRELIQSVAPDLDEDLKWGSPAYLHTDGVIMLVLSAHKAHANVVFTPSTRESFAAELTSFSTGKGSIKLPYYHEIPTELIGRMIRHRIGEYENEGVKWM